MIKGPFIDYSFSRGRFIARYWIGDKVKQWAFRRDMPRRPPAEAIRRLDRHVRRTHA